MQEPAESILNPLDRAAEILFGLINTCSISIGIRDLALRVSNGVEITMMFLCGWSVAKYVGFSKWVMSLAMVLIGTILVAATIFLGG